MRTHTPLKPLEPSHSTLSYWGVLGGPLIVPPLCRETLASHAARMFFFSACFVCLEKTFRNGVAKYEPSCISRYIIYIYSYVIYIHIHVLYIFRYIILHQMKIRRYFNRMFVYFLTMKTTCYFRTILVIWRWKYHVIFIVKTITIWFIFTSALTKLPPTLYGSYTGSM